MNEISRCCRVLNVKQGASLEEVKAEYRDLVQIWHPDRFSENERLRKKAQERLKEIILAWEYLSANAFQDGILHESLADPQTASFAGGKPVPQDGPVSHPPGPEEKSTGPRRNESGTSPHQPRFMVWLLCICAIGAFVWAGLLYLRYHVAAPTIAPVHANADALAPQQPAPALAEPPVTEVVSRAFPFATDVLAAKSYTNASGWLQAPPLLSPPFAVRVKLTVDNLAEFRLHYGLGQVVFNWDDDAKELLMESPRTAKFEWFPHQGILLPIESHEIVWELASNAMRVQVDGKVRCQTNGDFTGAKGYVSLGPYAGSVKLSRFDVETPQEPKSAPTTARDSADVTGDLLSSMLPEKNVTKSNQPDGLGIQAATDSADRLMTSESYQPPFIIRTRAKTDAYNLRLYCGAGMIIFNWELNERELRVHDPLNGQGVAVPGSGLISPNEWHTVVWEIQRFGMKLSVDGQLRFENHKDYRALDGKVGIGPYRSKVTAAYFQVERK